MAAVTTERLMDIALEMAGWSETPADSVIYYPGTRISHILLGVDIGAAELFMARQLGYHAVIAHHPAGFTGAVSDIYQQQMTQMKAFGVPHVEAETAVARCIAQRQAAATADNYDRVPSVARLLAIPFLSILSPLEEVGRLKLQAHLAKLVNAAQADMPTIGTLRDTLINLPEYAAARTTPHLIAGDWDAPAGKVAYSLATCFSPDAAIARAYFAAGAHTLICATFAYEAAQQLADEGCPGNLLALGSIATANLGINSYVMRLRTDGLEVSTFSGAIEP